VLSSEAIIAHYVILVIHVQVLLIEINHLVVSVQ